MKKIIFCISIFYFSLLNSQVVELYKQSCFLTNSSKTSEEEGFIYVNNSNILTNSGDSCFLIDLKTGLIINRFYGRIKSEVKNQEEVQRTTERIYFNSSWSIRSGSNLYFIISESGSYWFAKISSDLKIDKICKITGDIQKFIEFEGDIILVVGFGEFYSNGSSVPTSFSPGLLRFTKDGYLKRHLKVNRFCTLNGGYYGETMGYSGITTDSHNIYLCIGSEGGYYSSPRGFTVDNTNYESLGFDKYILKISKDLGLVNKVGVKGNVKELNFKKDSLIVSGWGSSRLECLNSGLLNLSNNKEFHFFFNLDSNFQKFGHYCLFNGNLGVGFDGAWNSNREKRQCFRMLNNHSMYYTYEGSIFGDKIYTSAGSMSFLLGAQTDFKLCEPVNYLNCTSLTPIAADFDNVNDSLVVMSIDNSDFFLNDVRYNNGQGKYYFLISGSIIKDFKDFPTLSVINTSMKPFLIDVFPNPAKDNIVVKLNIHEVGGTCDFKLFNNLGRCIYSKTIFDTENNISIDKINCGGLHYYSITDKRGRVLNSSSILLE